MLGDFYFGDAGVFDVEGGHFGEGQVENEREDHADGAAVGDDGDFLVGRMAEDLAQGVIDAAAKIGGGLGFGDRAKFELVEPIEGADLKAFVNLVPGEAGPGAEIDFAQAGQDDRLEIGPVREGREGLLDALHGAGIHDGGRVALEIIGGGFDLLMAERGEFHVDFAAEDFVVAGFDFAMAEQVKASWADWSRSTHVVRRPRTQWGQSVGRMKQKPNRKRGGRGFLNRRKRRERRKGSHSRVVRFTVDFRSRNFSGRD